MAQATVRAYAESVPDGFLFTVKAPNSLTMTHYYPRQPKAYRDHANRPNEHFLSQNLLRALRELNWHALPSGMYFSPTISTPRSRAWSRMMALAACGNTRSDPTRKRRFFFWKAQDHLTAGMICWFGAAPV